MTQFTLPALTFRQMLTGALVAALKEDHVAAISTVLLEVVDGQLFVVSTDRYRLVVAESRVFSPGWKEGSILMKYDNAVTLLKTIPVKPKPDETIEVRSLTGLAYKVSMSRPMDTPSWDCQFTAVNEAFPNFRTLIPSEATATETVNFDPAFLADVVKVPHDRKKPVTWMLNGPVRPAKCTWMFNDVDWTYLLMPVRIRP